jgi:Na+(H+)/acetate symporter ActP
MRSITFVQAFQYWLKLTAISVPVIALAIVWYRSGAPDPSLVNPPGAQTGQQWLAPLASHPADGYPVYRIYSLLAALFFGTMGLPHVLVRFYTNPDGRAARRTTLAVIGLLSLFYIFPPVYGALGRIYAPDLFLSGRTDAVVLLLPGRMVHGLLGELLSALVTAGAFAAFLSTASGLTVSVAGVLSQDLFGRRWRSSVAGFRLGAIGAVLPPAMLSLIAVHTSLADTVGLAFAVAASTFCPLLVLGIWWRGLTPAGAVAGLLVGGLTATIAAGVTISGGAPSGPLSSGLAEVLLAEPAAWTMPIAFLVMVVVSWATARRQGPGSPGKRDIDRIMVLLHTPEGAKLDRRLPGQSPP